ncbi:MAG: 2-oxoglutarate dehydrogenase complex dihydrolipoyllysine-residue succinyltransferase [Rhodobacteraceae bacterium]|nr:2-oxoglutarate dehydrogenase complex dihydrolipoyllysine-residue succinyltransferase [Paracoccaceae bacterium]
MPVDVIVPALGESVSEATVANWAKQQGEQVEADEIICELETDKVTLEVRAQTTGTVSAIIAPDGTTVGVGSLLAQIEAGKAGSKAAAPEAPSKPAEAPKAERPRDTEDAPSARKMMAEHELKRDQIQASGRDDRIMKADVRKALQAAEAAAAEVPEPVPPAAYTAQEERVRMSRLRMTIARRLKEAQNIAAMLTTYNEVDMSGVMALRSDYKEIFEQKHGVRLGFMGFFVKACSAALLDVPEVNAEIDGDDIVYKRFVHMGVAVGTPNGLVVPVLRHTEQLSFGEIERGISEMAARARDGKLTLADMQGGTFTISNGGVYGSLMSSPILNPPQSGILGMHKIQQRPVALDGEVVIRPMMYIALSYDHRIVDGKGAVTFLVRVKELIEDPRRLLMEI